MKINCCLCGNEFRNLFQNAFDLEAWKRLMVNYFDVQNTLKYPLILEDDSTDYNAYYLGKTETSDGYSLGFFKYDMKSSIDKCKVCLRKLVKSYLKYEVDAALVVFNDNNHWRLSFICDIKGEETAPKRYTYVFGEKENYYNTPVARFIKLQSDGISFKSIKETFAVESLAKQFYNDLFAWYLWANDVKSNVSFPNDTNIEDDDREKLDVKIIRLITRMLFVWFIKQKKLVPNCIFDETYLTSILKNFDPESTTDGTYYNAILQNLFFATLNRAIVDEEGNKRGFATNQGYSDVKTLYRYAELFNISESEVIKLFSEVPFLNCGLFECQDKTIELDGVEKSYNFDGFSRNSEKSRDGRFKWRAVVPNILFFEKEKGLLSILNRYNFTIEENSPNEQQVALDPELLGKVFENLLGAYNTETQETARKKSGSFYTPREVVNYMVDESLQAYLGDSPVVKSVFDDVFEKDSNSENEYKEIATKLQAIKILDPACGSGAFPMGLLNRMVDILQKIHPRKSVYDLKLSIIENCIYGSDIQYIAVQISKLRFFISLICDCEKDATKPNFGIPTLPNLGTHFVAADSLLSMKKKKNQIELFEDPEIEPTKQKLKEIRHEHFSAKSAAEKMRLRKEDTELRNKLAKLLIKNQSFAPDDAKQLAGWNPYDQNAVAEFFDPSWMFGVNDGFDIVIGNPPYVQLQNNGGALAKQYEKESYKVFAKRGDIYCLFYERGAQLLKPHGHLCFITSNKWMRSGYGEKMREYFTTQTNPKLLVDFAGVKVFESATVDTNILLFEKAKNEHKTICAVTSKENKDSIKNLSVFVQQHHSVSNFDKGGESWVIFREIDQSIKRKIEAVGTPLKDWDIQIKSGISTGFNDAFIISTEKRDEILSNCKNEEERKKTAELIRPILRGRDIKRYSYEWANLWLIATFPAKHYDIEDYPAVKEYLLSFGMERLEQTGKNHTLKNGDIVKARSKTNNKWFETQNSISYWEDFSRPKLIYPNMTKYLPFVYDDKKFLTNQKCFIVTGKNIEFLTAFLNSSIFKYCFSDAFPELLGGTRLLCKMFFDKIPVLQVTDKTNEKFKVLIKDIQNEYTEQKAKEIDKQIFELYGLNEGEIYAITNFLLFEKAKNEHKTICAVTSKENKDSIKNLSVFLSQNFSVNSFNGSDSWVILSPIEQSIKAKIEKVGTPLKDWDINIYRGVLTGCNEAFIISTEKRNEILENCKNEDERKRTAELIRPILRGRDIKRYGYVDNGLYLINTHNGVRGRIPRIKIEDYPAVKAHLDQYWDRIATRADKGDTPYNLRNCAYLEDFFTPKIMYAEIVQEPKFYLDKKNFLPEATSFILTGENLEYLVKVFNSKITAYLFKTFYAGGGLGEAGFRYKKAFFENLPIPRIDKQQMQSFEKSNNDEEISIQLVKIYGFSQTEIDFIARKVDELNEEDKR